MANQKISDIFSTAPKATLDGTEYVELSDTTTKACTTQAIANLASGEPSGTDYDISAGNETYDLDTPVAAGAGTRFRVSWSGGDGTYTFSFDNVAGRTIDGIAAADYTGEGVGHLDLIYNGSGAFNTLGRGEIWDSDGGNFTHGWKKYLDGEMILNGTDDVAPATGTSNYFGTTAGTTYYSNDTLTYGITFVANPRYSAVGISGGGQSVRNIEILTAGTTNCTVRLFGTNGTTYTYNITATGRWTASYPRIT